MPNPNTVKVVSEDFPEGFVIINEEDFDPEVHKRYVEKDEKKTSTRQRVAADEK